MAMSTMFPKFSTKVEGETIIMEQRLLKKVSHLVLNSSKCTGCGICADACPKEAISLGMVGAAARGATEGAPIVVDPATTDKIYKVFDGKATCLDVNHALCAGCGVCVEVCPYEVVSLVAPKVASAGAGAAPEEH